MRVGARAAVFFLDFLATFLAAFLATLATFFATLATFLAAFLATFFAAAFFGAAFFFAGAFFLAAAFFAVFFLAAGAFFFVFFAAFFLGAAFLAVFFPAFFFFLAAAMEGSRLPRGILARGADTTPGSVATVAKIALLALLAAAAPLAEAGEAAREVEIPMRDGAVLAADLYLPSRAGRHPTVLIQTPYNKRFFGGPLSGVVREGGAAGRGSAADALALLDREHYAYVVVDWRGFFRPRAAQAEARRGSWRRGLDGFDCVEWIARQEWSDGKVGTWGGSALGKQQLDTAAEKPPHLVCCVPLIASMGQDYESYYEGGVAVEAHVEELGGLGFGVSGRVGRAARPDQPVWRFVRERTYRPEAVGVPSLFITGWWDNYPDQVIATFEDVAQRGGPGAAQSKLLVGPWDHVSVGLAKQGDLSFPGAAGESGRAAKAFLDFWLRGEKDNGWKETPRVRYWRIGGEGWHAVDSWSTAPRETTRLHVAGAGRLGAAAPAEPLALPGT